MEEDPQDHNFDQRRDGPTETPTQAHRPSVRIDTDSLPRRNDDLNRTTSDQSAKTMPEASREPNTPIASPPRRSTQISRTRRQSRDFDVRRDGPYGRPSLTMTRRRSSGHTLDPVPTPHTTAPEAAVVDSGEQSKEDGEPPPAPSMETMQSSTDAAFEPEPPPLNYTLHTRKLSIFIFWSLILIDSVAMPIVLYFCLWYDTNLTPNTVFSIVTAALGGASIIEYFLRFWRLWRHNSTCRVIGARRMYLDWFHWNFSFAWIVVMIELIVGTVPKHPPIRLLSMPLTTMLYAFGTELLIVDILRYFEVPAPIRISSIPKGAQLRPCIYSMIEDVCAVDGSGGTAFREALNKRYEASHVFRAMLRRLGFFWAIGAQSTAVLCTILIFTIGADAAYVVGWSVPFIWAGIWTLATFWYVKRCLRREKTAWAQELAAKTSA